MKSRFTKTVILFVSVYLLSSGSYAQDGSLDLSFDTDGRVTTTIGSVDNSAHAITLQSDGKIVVVAHSTSSSGTDFSVIRYNINGSLDNTFGISGVVTTSISSGDDIARSVAIQSDGKIVVVGESNNGSTDRIALVRYNSDGTLDNTFDTDGIVTTSVGLYSTYGNKVAIQGDGKIVVAGSTANVSGTDFAVFRYNTNGSLDITFDTDGIAITNLSANNTDFASSMAIQSDGKIVAGGRFFNVTHSDFALVRYNTDGSLDNTFDTDGIVTTAITGTFNEYGTYLVIQTDGKILLTGFSNNTYNDFITVRYNSDGSLDTSFGVSGAAITDFGTTTDTGAPTGIALQSDGKIIVVGYHYIGIIGYFTVVRYNTDGSLDNTFDTDGIVTTTFGASGDGFANATIVQPDGRILAAGSAYGTISDIVVARYNGTGVIPFAPTSLFVTPLRMAMPTGDLGLAWTDNSSNELGFQIQRSPDGVTGWVSIDSASVSATGYTDTGLTPSTAYFYRIAAFNAAGISTYSNIDSAITLVSSVSKVEFKKDILISPNPSNGLLLISFLGKSNVISQIEIYNVLGEKIYSKISNQSSQHLVDIEDQPKGIYFVKMYLTDKIHVQKIVVQ